MAKKTVKRIVLERLGGALKRNGRFKVSDEVSSLINKSEDAVSTEGRSGLEKGALTFHL